MKTVFVSVHLEGGQAQGGEPHSVCENEGKWRGGVAEATFAEASAGAWLTDERGV